MKLCLIIHSVRRCNDRIDVAVGFTCSVGA